METATQLGKIEEMTSKMSEIIDLQTGIIDEQFRLLCQYMTVEELDRSPLIKNIESVSELRTASNL